MKKILMTLVLAPVMAMAFEKNPDCTSADVAKLREQADAGDAEAQAVVGHCYEYGWGVETNRAEALKWYLKAAEHGRTTAQYRLWISFATGDGVEKDAKEAMKWYCELVRKNYQSLSGSSSEWKAEMQRIGSSRPIRTLPELTSLHQKQLDSLVAMGEEVKSKPPEVQTRYHTDLKVEKKVLDFLQKKNSTSCTCQNNAKCNTRNQFSRAKSKQLQETVGDYTWSYHVVNGEALIISDKRCCAVSPIPKGHVTIPTALGGAKVTGIGSSAFACSEITSVEIPSGVNQIGSCAFMGCSELGSMALPEGLTDIGRQAFAGCEKLKSITLPASVKSIGGGVFEWCRKLSEIKVAEGSQNFAIVGGVLYTKDLSELVMCPNTRTSVKIPSGVRNIGLSSFEGCEVLDSITIPEGVTNIGWSAFRYCRKLKTATIPASMVSIDEGVFSSCEALKEILVESGNRNFTSVDGVLYTKDRAELVMCPNALTSAVILPEVKTVRPYAFSGCAGLTSITIPNGVTNIRHGAFSDCNGLKSVVIPPSVAKLGQQAFSRCAELESVTFLGERPDSLKNDFGGSTKLRAIHVPVNAKSWAGMKEWQRIPLVFDAEQTETM